MPKLYERNGVWQADCYYVDDAGRRRRCQRSTGVKADGSRQSKVTAEINAQAIERRLALGQGRQALPATLRSAYARLLEDKKLAGKSAGTINSVVDKSVHPLRYFGESRDLRAKPITYDELRKYAAYARQTRKASTVYQELDRLRAAHKLATGDAPACPDLGKRYVPRDRVLSVAEFRVMLPHIQPKWRDHAIVYRHLGLSYSELYTIRASEIWLDRGPCGRVRVRGTKRELRTRVIPLTPQAREIFARRGADWPEWKKSLEHLTSAAKRAGIELAPHETVGTNVLRASFCTEHVIRGTPLKEIARLMGHSNTKMVELVYARLRADDLEDCMLKLESYDVDVPHVRVDSWTSRRAKGLGNSLRTQQRRRRVTNTQQTGAAASTPKTQPRRKSRKPAV